MNIASAVIGIVVLAIALIRLGQSFKSWWPLLGTFDRIFFSASFVVVAGFGVWVLFDVIAKE